MKKQLLCFIILAICGSSYAQVPSYVPSNGLVGWWPFNGNTNDESGNGNNGTNNGATLSTDRNGVSNRAFNFDGKTSFIEVANNSSLNLNSNFTISSWFNSDSMYDVPGTVKMILSKHRNGLSTDGYVYGIWNNNYSTTKRGMINFSGAPKFTTDAYPKDSVGDVYVNKWYHYVVTYDVSNSELKYYLNGSLIDTKTIAYSISTNTLNVIIGAEWTISGSTKKSFFNGKIDDIGVWNRVLNSQEINQLYNGNGTQIITPHLTEFNLYPNPSSNAFTIAYSQNPYSIAVYNSLGQMVLSQSALTNEHTFDISQWPIGVYYVELIDAATQSNKVQKLIRN